MQEEVYGLFLAAAVIFVGFLGAFLLNRKNIPDAIFLIGFGYILGHYSGWLDPNQFSSIAGYIGALALIAIMFESSLDIDLNELLISAKPALIMAFGGFIVSTLVTFFILYYGFGFFPENPLYSVLVGTIVGGGSGAVIASIAPRISIPSSLQLALSLESVLTDVFVIVFTLTILSIVKNQVLGGTTGISIPDVAGQIAAKFSTSLVLGFIGGIILSNLIFRFKKEQHIYVMTFAYLIMLYAGAEFVGGSGAITILTAGIILANLAYLPQFMAGSNIVDVVRYQLFSMESTHAELTLLIRVFFFVEVGLILDLSNVFLLMVSLLLSFALLIARYPLAYYISRGLGFRRKTGIAASVASVFYARGLAAAVMAIFVSQATVTLAGSEAPLVPPSISASILTIASAVILFTNIILTIGVILLKEKAKELLI